MAITTASTILKYASTCATQVETATVVGTIGTSGNATVVLTSGGVSGSPITLSVAVLSSDSATVVAGKIRTALLANADIVKVYGITGTGADIVLTRVTPSNNDSTLNLSTANGTCTGLTSAPTSVNTLAGGTFTKLCDIVSYPDMGSTPSKLDTTTLTETTYKTSMLGLQELPDLTFEANYDETTYNSIVALTADNYYLQLLFDTVSGKFDWQGQIRVFVNGSGVDEVRKMTITLSASTPIVFNVTN